MMHRNHRLLDADGQPIDTVTVDIPSLPLIDRADFPDLPDSMEMRLLAPWVVLYHPLAELSLRVPLEDLDGLARYVKALNIAVLKQAMGEVPEGEGYRIDG